MPNMFESFPILNKNSINGFIIFDDDSKTIIQFSSTVLSSYSNFIERVSPLVKKIISEVNIGNNLFLITRILFGHFENESSSMRVDEFNFDNFANTIVPSGIRDSGHVILEFRSEQFYARRLWSLPNMYYTDDSGYNSEESL